MRNLARVLGFLCIGFLFGDGIGIALGSRNGSGAYSLPAGNPVTSGTTISSTWANNTLADIGTELTNSLDRTGRGSMSGALKLSNGTSGLPALSFNSETSSGLYRAGAGDVRMQVSAGEVQKWAATGATFPLGLVCTQSQTDTAGITSAGNGSAAGVDGTGGSTNAPGIKGTGGTTNGVGVAGTGVGTGAGVLGTGGPSDGTGVAGQGMDAGTGVYGTGGPTNGTGVLGQGADGGTGVVGRGGAVSGYGMDTIGGLPNGVGLRSFGRGSGYAIEAGTGNIWLSASNPAASTGFTNVLTPANTPKMWGKATTDGSGNVVLGAGFNVSSVTVNTTTISFTFATALSANYACTATTTGTAAGLIYVASADTGVTTHVDVVVHAQNGASTSTINPSTTAFSVHVICMGLQ